MNKRIIGLILAGLICAGGQFTKSYANENLNEEVQIKTQQVRTQNGWVKGEYGEWYYYKNGKKLRNQWLEYNGKKYYFNSCNGSMVEGQCFRIAEKYYIFDKSGAMIEQTGWILLQDDLGYNHWYWGNGDGTIKTDDWIYDNGKWYYAGWDGRLKYDVLHMIGNKIYIFDKDGAMSKKQGWINIKYKLEGVNLSSWYWGNGDGTIKKDDWIYDNGKWYYAGNYGWLVSHGTYDIGNKIYTFDYNGVCVNPY